jgi:hypothetical protein
MLWLFAGGESVRQLVVFRCVVACAVPLFGFIEIFSGHEQVVVRPRRRPVLFCMTRCAAAAGYGFHSYRRTEGASYYAYGLLFAAMVTLL